MPNLIEIIISGKNEAKAAMAEAKKDSVSLSSTVSKLGVVSGAALVGIGVEAVRMATTYETATTRLVTSAGESTKNIDMVRQGMLNMAGSVGTSADDLAKGMYTVESAGYHGADGLIVLKAAAQGAKDEGADLATVSNAVTDALVDYHLKATDAADITSKMVTAVSFGKTTFQDFSGSMHNILPLASAMHLGFADVSGVLAEMTAHGMSADQASQNMANAMRSLDAPTSTMQKEFTKLGITTSEVHDKLGTVGLAGTLQFLADTAKKSGGSVLDQEAALKKLVGTAPGLSVALMTTGENFDATSKAIKGISSASADAQGNVKGFSEIQGTLGFKVAALKASFDSLMIELGNKLLPVVKDITDAMSKHKDVVVDVLGAVVLLMGAFVTYSLVMKAVTVATALWEGAQWLLNAALDANPVMIIVLALIALGAALYEILTHWSTVWGEVKKIADDVGKFVSKVWHDVADEAKKVWGDITSTLTKVWDSIAGLWDKTGGKAVTYIAQTWDKISKAVTKEWDKITTDLSSIWNNLVELWNDTGGKLLTAFSDVFNGIWNDIVEPIWTMMMAFWTDELDVLIALFQAGWAIIQGIFHVTWDLIVGIVKVAWDLIKTTVKIAIDAVTTVLKVAWDFIVADVQIAWDLIKAAINIPLDLIKDLLQLFVDFVTGKWSKLWGDVEKTAEDLWNNIAGFISSVLGTIENTVVKAAKTIIDGLINGLSSALSGVGHALGDIKNTFVDFFKDAVKWLWQAGVDIVQGLIDGIGSMASSAGNAIGSIASRVGHDLNPMNLFKATGGEVGGAATGGDRSGMVMVGEQGPELVRLPAGSTVRSNPDTMAALAGARGGGGTVQAVWVGPEGDELFTLIKRWVRFRFGNDPDSVQKAFGQAF